MQSLSSRTVLLLAVCAMTLTGCGVSQNKHQEAVKELEKIKSILTEQQKNLQEIQSEAKTIDEKKSEIKKLKDLEDSTFSSAEEFFNAHDNTNALVTYNAFVRDFPESLNFPSAQERIKQIKQIFAHEKWVADAPIRAAQARAAAIAQARAQAQAAALAQATAMAQAQEEGRLRAASQSQSQSQSQSSLGFSITRTAKGTGKTKGDAFAAACQELPSGAEQISTVYDWPGNQKYFTCKITYRIK
jgi:actin-related protein